MKKESAVEILPAEEVKESAPRLSLVLRAPAKITDGRDELNFAEFPLSTISDRRDLSAKTIVFEDKIFDRSKNEHVSRKLTITGSDAFGLPTPSDEAVLLALIQLSKMQNFESKRVHFTRYQILQLLKWPITGQSYERLDKALNRWVGVTMYYKNAWRDRSASRWVDESFHMLESVKIVENKSGEEKEPSYFEWNEVVYRSFRNGNVKSLDYDFFLSLESSIGKRLYRFLDKRFYHAEELEFDLRTLAYEHIGLSRLTPTGDLKRKLNAAIDELEEKGYLFPIPKESRFIKQAPKVWKVVFRKRGASARRALTETPATESPSSLLSKLIEFGVREKTAQDLIEKYGEKAVSEKLSVTLWLKEKKDSRVGNPPGFLISALQNEYAPPKEFSLEIKAKEEREVSKKQESARAEKERAKKEREEARERVKREAIEKFWGALNEDAKKEIEKEALSHAEPSKFKLLSMGGKTAEVLKQAILDSYVLEILANG